MRRRMWSVLVVVLLVAGCAGNTATPSEDTLSKIKRSGTIDIGYSNDAPMAFKTETGAITGESVELLRHALGDLQVTIVPHLTEFGALIPGLQAGRFDVVAAGMYITPARCRVVRFTTPTFSTGSTFIVKAGNPKHITSFESIRDTPDALLGTVTAALEAQFAKNAGVPDERIKYYPSSQEGFEAVRAGRIDAYAYEYVSGQRFISSEGKKQGLESTPLITTAGGKSIIAHGGLAVRLGAADDSLYEYLNTRLKAFIGTPEHLTLIEGFGFSKDNLPKTSTEDVCAGT
jgi:polar amino acid transport system substrate-binding protein